MNRNKFCPLPWIHLSLEPNGNVYSCCNTSQYNALGNVNEQSFQEILLGSASEKMRSDFRQGIIPAECKLCMDAEKHGHISLREASIHKFNDVNPDQGAGLRYLSLRLDNTCNLSCRMCNPHLSTSWYKDGRRMGMDVPDTPVQAFHQKNDLVKMIQSLPDEINLLYFAGGEPFLSESFILVLNELITMGKIDRELIINTNFTSDKFRGVNIFELLSKFKSITLDLSLDGMGELGEYIRRGMIWEQVEKRIFDVRRSYSTINLKLNPTISLLNVAHLPDFFRHMIEVHSFKPADIRLNPLTEPSHLHISHLPDLLKKQIKKNYSEFKKYLFKRYELSEIISLYKQMDGVISLLEGPGCPELFKKFIEESELWDKSGNLGLADVFPPF